MNRASYNWISNGSFTSRDAWKPKFQSLRTPTKDVRHCRTNRTIQNILAHMMGSTEKQSWFVTKYIVCSCGKCPVVVLPSSFVSISWNIVVVGEHQSVTYLPKKKFRQGHNIRIRSLDHLNSLFSLGS